MSTAYQGHLPGSGVQKHSAGDAFPYIVQVVEVGGVRRRFEVIGPGLSVPLVFGTAGAADAAAARLRTWSEQADAWAFAYESVTHSCFGGQRLQKVIDAGRAYARERMGGLFMFDDMTPGYRVALLLHMGSVRLTLPGIGPVCWAAALALAQQQA